MDTSVFTDSDCSDEEFQGFNTDDIQVATDRLAGQHDTSESESNLDITTDADSDSESDRETDNQDTSNLSSDDDDVPDIEENPVQWTEQLQQINVPPFTRASGSKLPSNWNPHSSPREYFQLFFTDELLHNICHSCCVWTRVLWQVARQRSDGDQLVMAGLGQLVMGVTFIPLFYGRAPLVATEREVLALFCTPTP